MKKFHELPRALQSTAIKQVRNGALFRRKVFVTLRRELEALCPAIPFLRFDAFTEQRVISFHFSFRRADMESWLTEECLRAFQKIDFQAVSFDYFRGSPDCFFIRDETDASPQDYSEARRAGCKMIVALAEKMTALIREKQPSYTSDDAVRDFIEELGLFFNERGRIVA